MPTDDRSPKSSPAARPPHPANLPRGGTAQRKAAKGPPGPHPATVSRGRAVQPKMPTRATGPHPATVSRGSTAQPKVAKPPPGPHPATVSRGSTAQPKVAKPPPGPHPATVSRRSAVLQRMETSTSTLTIRYSSDDIADIANINKGKKFKEIVEEIGGDLSGLSRWVARYPQDGYYLTDLPSGRRGNFRLALWNGQNNTITIRLMVHSTSTSDAGYDGHGHAFANPSAEVDGQVGSWTELLQATVPDLLTVVETRPTVSVTRVKKTTPKSTPKKKSKFDDWKPKKDEWESPDEGSGGGDEFM